MKISIILSIVFLFLLFSSHAQQNPEGLFINSRAPDFRGKNQHNEEVRLKDLLKEGSVVLVFYRGYWCPHCNRMLQKLEDSLSFFREKKVRVVAVTPENRASIDSTLKKTHAEYPIIFDDGLKIMKAYDVAFEVPENTLNRYKSSGLDIEQINGANGKYLPVPAVYIINQQMEIIYRYFETYYRKRPTVKELLLQL